MRSSMASRSGAVRRRLREDRFGLGSEKEEWHEVRRKIRFGGSAGTAVVFTGASTKTPSCERIIGSPRKDA